VIGPRAFHGSRQVTEIVFESDTRLREIGEAGFAECRSLKAFRVPSSVETIGDRAFHSCSGLTALTFTKSSKLKRIGKGAFSKSQLISITIPASTQEIDGSAFTGCPILKIQVAEGSRKFIVEGNLLLSSHGTKIVRYFGRERKVVLPRKVELLKKSCFAASTQIESLRFEDGSNLRRIDRYALSYCESLKHISIPASVESIERAALECCYALESCTFAEDASLVRIESEAFAECSALRSFCVPLNVRVIGDNCFLKCNSLHRLRFASSESLKRFVRDSTLNEALKRVGLDEMSIVLKLEVSDGRVPCEFPGWSSVDGGGSPLILVQDLP
jgi:hypothetical protein